MTSETQIRTETQSRPQSTKRVVTRDAKDTLQAVVHEVRGVVDGVRRGVPEVARASRTAVGDMVTAMETGSDDRTQAGVTLSLGLALGMLLGGAPRLLILLALGPVAAMALVLGDRRARRARTSAT